MQVILREILSSDVSQIAAIERDCFALPWEEEAVSSVYARADFCGVVAQIGEKTVGYLLGLTLFENAEVLRVAVANAYPENFLIGLPCPSVMLILTLGDVASIKPIGSE